MGTTQGCCMLFWTNPGSNNLQNSNCLASYLPSYESSKKDNQDVVDTAGEVRKNSLATFFCGLLHMDTLLLAD